MPRAHRVRGSFSSPPGDSYVRLAHEPSCEGRGLRHGLLIEIEAVAGLLYHRLRIAMEAWGLAGLCPRLIGRISDGASRSGGAEGERSACSLAHARDVHVLAFSVMMFPVVLIAHPAIGRITAGWTLGFKVHPDFSTARSSSHAAAICAIRLERAAHVPPHGRLGPVARDARPPGQHGGEPLDPSVLGPGARPLRGGLDI